MPSAVKRANILASLGSDRLSWASIASRVRCSPGRMLMAHLLGIRRVLAIPASYLVSRSINGIREKISRHDIQEVACSVSLGAIVAPSDTP